MCETKANVPLKRPKPHVCETEKHKFNIAGYEGEITVGLYPEGDPCELFVTMRAEGCLINGLLDSVGRITSLALQHGVPLKEIVDAMAGQRYSPDGPVNDPNIKEAKSIIDYVFRWLGREFSETYTGPTTSKPYDWTVL